MNLIWLTRGRTWGFRFVRNEGPADPLPFYDLVFAVLEDERQVHRRSADAVAVRFPDPEGRTDRAGRAVPHDFVVFGAGSDTVDSVDAALRLVWPLVAEEYRRLWGLPEPGPTAD